MTRKQRLGLGFVLMGAVSILFILGHAKTNPKSAVIAVAMLCFFVVTLVLPMYWTMMKPQRANTIVKGIDALRKGLPCDRAELRQACKYFPQDAGLRVLSDWPLNAPVPIELLEQISRSTPQVTDQASRASKWLITFSTIIFLLLFIVRFLSHFLALFHP